MSAPARQGRVILVGAGPGDPDLITLRGAAALRQADAVIYDALAAPELLDLAPPGALRINVGKRGHAAPTRTYVETVELMLRLAGEGRTVVRLKGGDPFVYGRGGEEASACAGAGIPFEVVPGVSSAIGALAYAGIPVTDRRHAASFAVVTGHRDPTQVREAIRWDELARAADTLIVLMGMRHLEEIVERILRAGRAPDTPAAVVEWAATAGQRVVEAPLAELPKRARAAALRAPAAVVVGEVVRLREQLAWFRSGPLAGRRVLVTRPLDQAGEMVRALRAAGAEPVSIPMIRMLPPKDSSALDRALGRIDRYDALIFTSRNAVRFTAERAAARGGELAAARARVFCVGPATARAAEEAGLLCDLLPAGRRDAEGLLAEIERSFPPAGKRFLLPRAEAAREVLPEGLRAAGAEVDAVPAYRNAPPDVDPADLRERLMQGELDVLTFTSPSTVRRFLDLLDADARAAAGRCTVAAIGPLTAGALREAGLPPDVVAGQAGALELVEALIRHEEGTQ